VLSPVRAVDGRPLRCSSSTSFLPSEKIFANERFVLLTLHHLQRPAEISMCCGGIFTEFNIHTHTKGITLRDVPCFHFQDRVHKRILERQGPTPHWGIAKPCHCKWWWRKDQSQRLSVFAGYSIASTARRKLISLLYCRTSYLHILILSLCIVGD
jgi:hypothetical protein